MPSDDTEALAVLMAERAGEVAAVITEPVQGAGGVYPPADGYLAELRRLCDHHGALLVFDEVITGFGRLGHWFAADRYGVVPDLTTFAKAVTSGYQPLGGVFVGRAVRDPLESDPAYVLRHGYTYSGHPAACAAGLANLAIMEREGLVERASVVGKRLGAGLQALAADGAIDHARGDGAVWAAGLRADQDAVAIRDRMLAAGVITRAIGTDTLTFCPPLVITEDQVDRIVDVLGASAVIRARPPARPRSPRVIRSPNSSSRAGSPTSSQVHSALDEVGAGRGGGPVEDQLVVGEVGGEDAPGVAVHVAAELQGQVGEQPARATRGGPAGGRRRGAPGPPAARCASRPWRGPSRGRSRRTARRAR